jgi:hypothetical protein
VTNDTTKLSASLQAQMTLAASDTVFNVTVTVRGEVGPQHFREAGLPVVRRAADRLWGVTLRKEDLFELARLPWVEFVDARRRYAPL